MLSTREVKVLVPLPLLVVVGRDQRGSVIGLDCILNGFTVARSGSKLSLMLLIHFLLTLPKILILSIKSY